MPGIGIGLGLGMGVGRTDGPPANVSRPVVTGTPAESEQLSTTDGEWSREPTGYTRQWQLSAGAVVWADAEGETAATLTLGALAAGMYARSKVIAENAKGFSRPAYSLPTERIAAIIPEADYTPDLSGGLPANFNSGAWQATVEGGSSGDEPGAFQAVGAAVSGTGSVQPAWPAHQEGDVALLFIETDEAGTIALSDAQGFTEVISPITSAFAVTKLGCYVCVATSDSMPAPTVSDAGDHVLAVIVTFRGIDPDNPINVVASASSGSTIPASTPSVTTTAANCVVVAALAHHIPTPSAMFDEWENANLTGLAERVDVGTSLGNGGGIAVASGVKVTAGATGTTKATPSNTPQTAGITVALNPMGATAGTPVATEGTWFVDFTADNDASHLPNAQWVVQAGIDGAQYIIYNRSGKWGCYIEDGGAPIIEADLTAFAGDRVRMALRLKEDDFALAINGHVTSKVKSGTVPAVGELVIGAGTFSGTIHTAEFYASELTDAQLATLTEPASDPGEIWSGAVDVPDDFFGICCHRWPTNADGGEVSAEPTYRYNVANSVDHNGLQWREIQPSNAASRDWTALDAWADANKAKGAALMYCLYGTPTSLARAEHAGTLDPYGYPGGGSPPENLSDLADFVTALVQRCASRGVPLDYLQVGNEWAEDGLFWLGTWEDAAACLRVAAVAARAVDPNIKIISNGLTRTDFVTAYLLASDGDGGTAADHLDGLAHNPFAMVLPEGMGNSNSDGADHTIVKRTADLRAAIVAGGLPADFPIYGTGQALAFNQADGILTAWTETMLGQYTARMCLRMISLGWKTSIWYAHDDALMGNPAESETVSAYLDVIGRCAGRTMTQLYLHKDGRYSATFASGAPVTV